MARPRKTSERPPITRDRALQAAIALADQEGLEAITMRKLAQALQVEAMSLYHHVSGKDDILDGMVDLIFAEMWVPVAQRDWQQALRDRATDMRKVLRGHPWAIALMASRNRPGMATLQHLNSTLGCLRHAGFSVPLAAHALSLMDSYIYGFVLQETQLPFQTPEQREQMVGGVLQMLPGDQYAHLVELSVQHVLQPDYDYASEFSFGLQAVLDILQVRLEATSLQK